MLRVPFVVVAREGDPSLGLDEVSGLDRVCERGDDLVECGCSLHALSISALLQAILSAELYRSRASNDHSDVILPGISITSELRPKAKGGLRLPQRDGTLAEQSMSIPLVVPIEEESP